jgi:hypothetical protein
MSTQTITPELTPRATAPDVAKPTATAKASQQTSRLLSGGIVAGPLFLVVWAPQAFTRDGFEPERHPISLLSLGDLGWLQIANFVVTGALFVACAVGLRRVVHPGRGGTWGPRLIGALGSGLITAGVFVTDAGAGFPAGAPEGTPEMSWHGVLHEVGYVVVMLSWTAACFVLRSRFVTSGRRGWARACLVAVAAVVVISAWPHPDSFTIRIVIATAVQFGFIAAVATYFRQRLREANGKSAAL